MSREDYQAALVVVLAAARALADLPIPELLQAIAHSHAVGPILDPTLYHRRSRAMDEDAEVLRAALPLRNLGCRLAQRALEAGSVPQ